MISIIAAVGKNMELGLNNELIWHLKGDMKFFRETTINHTVVMGRHTYESIGKPLPNRKNIVITRSNFSDVIVVNDPREILELSKNEDIFIIGGASIYEYFLPYADNLYLTLIDDNHACDAYFPIFDECKYDKEILDKNIEDGIEYKITLFKRK